MNIFLKIHSRGDTNLLLHLINILKNDIYEPDIMAFITILNNFRTAIFNLIMRKSTTDEQISIYC